MWRPLPLHPRVNLERFFADLQKAGGFLASRHLPVSLTLLTASFLPFLILGQDSHVILHDNLDGLVPELRVLADGGKMWEHGGEVEAVITGVPRSCLPSGLNLISLFFIAFPPFAAYLINHILVHALAFWGMYRLLEKLLPEGGFINGGVALCFSMLPFYVMFGLSVAGQPLLLSAVLAFFRSRARFLDLAIVLVFPFYSNLVRTGAFIVAVLGAWLLIDLHRRKRLNPGLSLCLALLACGYLLADRLLVRDVLLGGSYVSHRVEFGFRESNGLVEAGQEAFRNFRDGHYHAASLHRWILLLAVPAALVVAGARRDRRRFLQILGWVGLALLFSAALGLQNWRGLNPLKEEVSLLAVWHFGRFHWLHPLVWFVAFGLALDTIRRADLGDLGRGKRLAAVLLATQTLFVVSHNQEITGSTAALARRALGGEDWRISYADFYSEGLFDEIDRHIGSPKAEYRTISIGLHPAIAAYNGFHTLDFYLPNYPLAYKHRFRRIIAAELEKNGRWRRYFDRWGSRCYAFASELPEVSIQKSQNLMIRDLDLGTAAFREMGGEYVFSAVEIENHIENDLAFEGVFEDEDSPWRVWLYRARNRSINE